MRYTPVYYDNNNGTASFSGIAFANGQYFNIGIPPNPPFPLQTSSADAAANYLLTTRQAMAMQGGKGGGNSQYVPVQELNGRTEEMRIETPGANATFTLTISLDYSAATLKDPERANVLWGDSWHIIRYRLNLPPVPASLVVGGDYGTSTASIFEQVAVVSPVRLKTMQVRATKAPVGTLPETLFNDQPLRLLQTNNVQGAGIENVPYNFEIDYAGYQLDRSVRRVENFKCILGSNTAFMFSIPRGFAATWTFNLYSQGAGDIMQLVYGQQSGNGNGK